MADLNFDKGQSKLLEGDKVATSQGFLVVVHVDTQEQARTVKRVVRALGHQHADYALAPVALAEVSADTDDISAFLSSLPPTPEMTETTYRLTCRPAWAENAPPGFTALHGADSPTYGDYGTVTYPEPLPADRADHFSLQPTGPELPRITWDGATYPLLAILGGMAADGYAYRTGQMDEAGLAARIAAQFADYGVGPDEYTIGW